MSSSNHGGARPNSGRKKKTQSEELQHLLNSVWKQKDRKKTLEMLVEDSVSSDSDLRHKARTLLLAYAFGKPIERTELTGAEGKDLIPSEITHKIDKFWGDDEK